MDALIYGHIRAILTTPVPVQNNAFGFVVDKFKTLINYVKKIDQYVMDCNTDFTVYPYRVKGMVRKMEASFSFPILPSFFHPFLSADTFKTKSTHGSR